MRLLARILFLGILFQAGALVAADIGHIEVRGPIGPATAEYIARALNVATAQGDSCLIIQLNTPGGLLNSTEEIVEKFYSSKIPVVVYVAPAPGGAASAGVFITMAADVAAMAPHTSIGAAHPVNVGFSGDIEKVDDVMKKKQESYYSSFARGIAEKRHRNAQWAESAVTESASATAEEALKLHVIDLIADNLPDLLKKLDGRKLESTTLATAGARVVPIPMAAHEKFLQLFLRPEVMFILMLVVIYGIIGELSSPGAILPGVAGAIALILVLYLSAILPVNVAGLCLILLALALFIIDLYSPTHGVLTFGGIVAFFLGGLMLFNHAEPGFRLPLAYVISGTALTALFFLFVVGAGLRAQRLPVRAGSENLLGRIVPAAGRIDVSGGKVFVEGEYWNAMSETAVEKDQPVEIIGMQGLTLKVKPANPLNR